MIPTFRYLELVGATLYDTVAIDPIPMRTRYHLFSVPIGQRDPNFQLPEEGGYTDYKQFLHTNQEMAAMLPSPRAFCCYRINAVFLHGGIPLRLYETSLYGRTEISFMVNRKEYWRSPAWRCASPYALFETPDEKIAELKQKYAIDWAHIGGTLGFERYIPVYEDANTRTRMPYFGADRDDFGSKHLDRTACEGVVIDQQVSFQVEANVFDEGPQDDLQLAVHIDGIEARANV